MGNVVAMEIARNQVVCPRCGEVKLETPPGTTALPTLGMAKKAAGTAGECECGRRRHEQHGAADSAPSAGSPRA